MRSMSIKSNGFSMPLGDFRGARSVTVRFDVEGNPRQILVDGKSLNIGDKLREAEAKRKNQLLHIELTC